MLLGRVATLQIRHGRALPPREQAREGDQHEVHKILREEVTRPLRRLDFSYFEHISYLILKEYHIFLKIDGEIEKVNLLITVDAFINIYLSQN